MLRLIGLIVATIVIAATSASFSAEDRREMPPSIMGGTRHFFAEMFKKTYGADAEGATFTSCTSTDEDVGLNDFYLFRPRPPGAPVLVYYYRDDDDIGNYGTVSHTNGRIHMLPGNGAVGTAESQRIVVEPLLALVPEPAGNIADAFKPRPPRKCAFAASDYYKRPAMPAPE